MYLLPWEQNFQGQQIPKLSGKDTLYQATAKPPFGRLDSELCRPVWGCRTPVLMYPRIPQDLSFPLRMGNACVHVCGGGAASKVHV